MALVWRLKNGMRIFTYHNQRQTVEDMYFSLIKHTHTHTHLLLAKLLPLPSTMNHLSYHGLGFSLAVLPTLIYILQ